ncbi:TetR/AcrR family transcriptional regulator C-terminal domain-containing protein [Streptomyces sp. FXJ1.172]|uniref:TetR/AcrR family transcriptional regulator n=1 Tax=Streptomyces sp. FXJ1.172 TaxID=710705 RepID=UPI0007D037E2|nr:TetR/AcrR family transcriptional regulator C-terminal domain-containing protein [Streptomyces sp. FXJ1.172]WEO96856.1 TetR/AcrR family transcriptional regulator C-terminal domain-containing protein [Streptomyces sp. FXJ1.172]
MAGRSEEKQDRPRDPAASLALLWGEQGKPSRGPKPKLSPQRIAAAAAELADAEGLDAVSMSRVAGGFGVSAMALYRYVPGKTELVALMVESVLAEAPDLAGVPAGDWRAAAGEWTRRCARVYAAHPWLLGATAMRRRLMGPCELRWLDSALAALEPTRLGAAERHQVFLLLIGLVRNLAQQRGDYEEEGDAEWGRLSAEVLARHADRYPALTKAVADGVFDPDGIDPLEFGLDRILDGVEALMTGRE